MTRFDLQSLSRGFLAALAATVLLATPAQAQRASLNTIDGKLDDVLDTQNHGAIPIGACGTIDQPGSYVVVQNLDAAGDCLLVTADNVTIDLGGHVLSGDGTGDGVTTDADELGLRRNIAVHSGTVTGFVNGIDLLLVNDSTVRHVRAVQNGGVGILAGLGSNVNGNTASGNDFGLIVNSRSTATGNTALDNSQAGIFAFIGSRVTGNTTSGNDTGIAVICPSNVIGNTATDNTSDNLFLNTNAGECNAANNLAPAVP